VPVEKDCKGDGRSEKKRGPTSYPKKIISAEKGGKKHQQNHEIERTSSSFPPGGGGGGKLKVPETDMTENAPRKRKGDPVWLLHEQGKKKVSAQGKVAEAGASRENQ